ncbi:MAG: hypothetical protein H7Y42_10595 [Chitinophagaceae bacterium]|nr:hypothetical protein [Chitinophagaceae bacterium]
MRQFIVQHRNSIPAKAVYSASTISLFLYIIIRALSYDFPMSWTEEIVLFSKILFTGSFLISLVTIGCAGLYGAFERMKRRM